MEHGKVIMNVTIYTQLGVATESSIEVTENNVIQLIQLMNHGEMEDVTRAVSLLLRRFLSQYVMLLIQVYNRTIHSHAVHIQHYVLLEQQTMGMSRAMLQLGHVAMV